MSVWADLADGIRNLVLMQDAVDKLQTGVERISDELDDHDRRLVRLETIFEIALASRIPRA